MVRIAAAPLIACLVLGLSGAAAAETLVVASAAAMKAALNAALPGYQAAQVEITYGTAGQVDGTAAASAPLDLVILPPARLNQLGKEGRIAPSTITPLGVTEIGVALRDGSKPVKTGSVYELKMALLAAPSVGIANPATGATTGVHLSQLLQQSGLDQQLGNHLRVFPDGTQAMQALARGEIGMALGQVSEMKPVPGIFQTGTLPPSWQLHTVYAGAVTVRSSDPPAAKALLAWMASPAVTPYLEKAGLKRP